MALQFNGSSDYVDAGNSAVLQPLAQTVSCWVNIGSLASAYTGVVVSNNPNLNALYVKSTGKLAIYITGTGGFASYDGTGSTTLAVNTLYHIAWTYSNAAGLVGYVNAVSDGTGASNGTLNAYDAASGLFFGEDPTVAGRFLSGSLSNVSVFSSALSASQIALLASGISPLAVSDTLSAYWPLAGNNAALDRGPNGLLATTYGAAAFNDPAFPMPYPRRVLSTNFAEGEMPALFTAAAATTTLYELINW